MNKSIDIVDSYLYKFGKSPSEKMFEKLGGNLSLIKRKYGTYRKFLEVNGYDAPSRAYTLCVVDGRNRIVAIGISSDLCTQFGVTRAHFVRCVRDKILLNYKYRVVRVDEY